MQHFTRVLVLLLTVFVLISLAWSEVARAESDVSPCTMKITLDGAVGPATSDYFERALRAANEHHCDSLLFLINTPGGNLQTTRILVEEILDSTLPVLCYVWPPGGHAGSAGAIILQACHVSGAAPATNIGAATPVSATAHEIPQDLRTKLIEDTKSWLISLARLRGRSELFAEESITKGRALDAEAAAKLKAIDTVARDVDEFLRFARGRPVKTRGERIEAVKTGPILEFGADLRHKLLNFLTDPEFAYLLFMASLVLLYVEFTHPGVVLPGVLGSLGLIVSLIAFHKLDVWWGGVALIGLGMAFLIAEGFVAGFGFLGLGGLVSIAAGSIFLYDPAVTGGRLPYAVIFGFLATVGVGMLVLAMYIYRSRVRRRAQSGAAAAAEDFRGQEAKVVTLEAPSRRRGMVEVKGELWRFQTDRDVEPGSRVEILGHEGLVLRVRTIVSDKMSDKLKMEV